MLQTLASIMSTLNFPWKASADLSFDAVLSFTTGALSGQSFNLRFSVAGDTGASYESATPIGATNLTLLSFTTNIDHHTFDMKDDFHYKSHPCVGFSEGVVIAIDYITSQITPPGLNVNYNPQGGMNYIVHTGVSGVDSAGVVLSVSRVPEPSTIALVSSGLPDFAATRRKI